MVQGLRARGVPEDALQISISSLANSSIKQYNSSIRLWWIFCLENNLSLFEFSVQNILNFLSFHFNKGASYSSLNTMRAALSFLISPEVGSDTRIKRFFKGIFRIRPPEPRYKETWNPDLVLNFFLNLPPNEELGLKLLSHKLATLLALVTAHRIQTLQLILISNIEISEDWVCIKVPDFIKTSGPNRFQPYLKFPFFREKPKLCAASALISYLNETKAIRPLNVNNLFITTTKPHKEASRQTISRWIKFTLSKSGIDTSVFRAQSTRHASTSAAARKGMSVETIREAAGWSATSQVFARFYNRPLTKPNFATAIIP